VREEGVDVRANRASPVAELVIYTTGAGALSFAQAHYHSRRNMNYGTASPRPTGRRQPHTAAPSSPHG
jgi:hypothetical protein